jgi:hypothetical protein
MAAMKDESRLSPAWLRPGALGLVACVHLAVFLGVPWPGGTGVPQPAPVEIEVIASAQSVLPVLEPAKALATEVKPAPAAKAETPVVESQPLPRGRTTPEVKPLAPAFATNIPAAATLAPAGPAPELKPVEASGPAASAEDARPVPEAAGPKLSARPASPAPPRLSANQPTAEARPLLASRPAVRARPPEPVRETAGSAPAAPAEAASPLLPSQAGGAGPPLAGSPIPQAPRQPDDAPSVLPSAATPPAPLSSSGERRAESQPLASRPVAQAQSSSPAQAALAARPPAAAVAPAQPAREPESAPPGQTAPAPADEAIHSADQRVVKLEVLASEAPAAAKNASEPAREVLPAGAPAIASRPPDQELLVGTDKQAALIRPFPPIQGPLLHDQGPLRTEGVEKIVRYVEQYDGGDCFYVAPVEVSGTAARLEGYGASDEPFRMLNSAFLHENGYEATIDVRLVAPAQCPAVAFLGRLRGASAPHLRIDSTRASPAEPLTGTVDGYGDWNVALLLATDLGLVQNVSHLLKPQPTGKTFTIRPADIGEASVGQPQLLIAIATLKPFNMLRFGAVTADRLFPALLSEAQRTNQPAAAMARYFKLEP